MKLDQSNKKFIVREYRLDFGTVQVFDNYIVSNFDEGITVTLETAYQVMGISEIHFRDKKFGFISLRTNSYSVDPTVYDYIRQMNNVSAFAIVSRKEIDMHNFKIEKMFYKKEMKFFIEYENAVTWVKRKVNAAK